MSNDSVLKLSYFAISNYIFYVCISIIFVA